MFNERHTHVSHKFYRERAKTKKMREEISWNISEAVQSVPREN